MNKAIKEQIIFVLEDDNEVMTAALAPDSELDEENQQMNSELIREHKRIIEKVGNGEALTKHGMALIRDANDIHLNDESNLAEHHQQAVTLDSWLKKNMEVE